MLDRGLNENDTEILRFFDANVTPDMYVRFAENVSLWRPCRSLTLLIQWGMRFQTPEASETVKKLKQTLSSIITVAKELISVDMAPGLRHLMEKAEKLENQRP